MSINWSDNSLNSTGGLDVTSSTQFFRDSVGTLDTRDPYQFGLSGRSSSDLSLNSLSANANFELIQSQNWSDRVHTDVIQGITLGTRVDFNGDGKTDFLRQEKGSWDDDVYNTANVFLSNGNGSFNKITLPESFDLKGDLTNLYMGDFNGDGKTDFLRQEKGNWDDDANNTANIFLSNGNGSFNKVNLPESFDLKGDLTNLYMGDFNGDGKTDFLRQEKGGWDDDADNTANVFLSNGNGTFNKITLPESFDLKGDLTNLYMGDFNGDGKTDFLRQEKGGWDDDADNTANVFLSNGNGTFNKITLPESFDLKGDLTNLYMGDFNGDGKTDFLRQEKGDWDNDADNTANIFLSNGNGSFNKITLPESFDLKGDLTNLYMGDFNGDGKTDFLRQEKGDWDNDADNTANVFLSNGNGSFSKIDLPESFDLKGDLSNLFTDNASRRDVFDITLPGVSTTNPKVITALDKLLGIRQITDPLGNYPGQCVSFVKRYTQELGITMNRAGGNSGAKYMFINYNKPGFSLSADKADRITFTGTEKPQVGDIVVFDATSANPYGHIAVIEAISDTGQVIIQESNANNAALETQDSNGDGMIGTTVTRSQPFNLTTPPRGYGKVMGWLHLKL